MIYQELLREKAIQVCERCNLAGLSQPFYYITSEYSVNFSWQFEGKKHTLALYYKARQQSWMPVPNSAWLRQFVLPVLQPLFEQRPIKEAPSSPRTSTDPVQEPRSQANFRDPVQELTLQTYFADALACLSLLEPFASDNIDFSIICQRTKASVKMILNNSVFSEINRTALSTVLDIPDSTDFYQAKEYLTRCLILCNINNASS